MINTTPPTRIPLRESQSTPGTSHPGFWKSQKVEWGKKNKDGKEYWWCRGNRAGKGQWVCYKIEDHGNRTGTSPSGRGGTKPTGEVDINKKMNLTKYLKAGILSIKDQSSVQTFLYQFDINAKGNK